MTHRSHWMQNSVDKLTEIFGRRVMGIHSPTSGMVFDVIKCLVQRNFCYATEDAREAYEIVRTSMLDSNVTKIVLILHSQGCIAGSLMIDWLTAEMSLHQLEKLEIYTFGNAANHFNDPHKMIPDIEGTDSSDTVNFEKNSHGAVSQDSNALHTADGQIQTAVNVVTGGQSPGSSLTPPKTPIRLMPYIEHYVNTGDFVCRWGVMHFAQIPNRFLGHVLYNEAWGHLFIQHYLDRWFLGPPPDQGELPEEELVLVDPSDTDVENELEKETFRFSRLWRYRGGDSPAN
ncbi:uncharacterized protein ATNIH1004_000273 [Aspergillus tanneri]|uniref:DUF676 domain-containing protein n=1 Tax=Aspergillus tanneri TaxID=1220188 RepID=A0A5M9MW90_9EURO|nr:uncharacterized protein ATNIH1004_000273 [Aspergillus tanneri]KAA8651391.1 hypothetical protein ATNIH1004_000273 [Aspergillus tanneri]